MSEAQNHIPSSFFGELNVADYSYQPTLAAKRAAYAIRSLQELVRDDLGIATVSRCFPYRLGRPWPQLAKDRIASGQYFLQRCQNKNACPTCSRAKDAAIRKQFAEGFDIFVNRGYRPWWQTLELGYLTKTTGRKRVKAINSVWRKLQQAQKFRNQVLDGRIVNLRVTEFTLRDGVWTPHMHIVWLFRADVSDADIQTFLAIVQELWRRYQAKELYCKRSNLDLYSGELDATSTSHIAYYLFKAFYFSVSNIGAVLPDQPRTPLDHLLLYALTGDLEGLKLWKAYEAVSSNVRRYKFSRGWALGLLVQSGELSN
jgi:hypothetical protein